MPASARPKITLRPYPTKIHKEELIELLDLREFAPGINEQITVVVEQQVVSRWFVSHR